MIVIRAIPVAKHPQESLDFQTSLANQASDKGNYCVVGATDPLPPEAKICISLPDNCIVLGNSWDKYVLYALQHGLPKGDPEKPASWMTWRDYVKKRFNLVDKNHHGIFSELSVEYPIATT